MKKLFLALLFVSSTAFAGSCDNLYIGGVQLIVPETKELCNSFYVVAYSETRKGPVVAFERLDSAKASVKRTNVFRPDTRIDPTHRAELKDYIYSGWDRGHMVPAADAGSKIQMKETFLLSNITPQNPRLNGGNWRDLETHVRDKSKEFGGITYVATGAIYGVETLGANSIGIPTRYYKVVWYSNRLTEAYYADNIANSSIIGTSVDTINIMTGITFQK